MISGSILIVEDNPTTRKMIRVALELEGLQVIEAGDGFSALAEMRKKIPDLIVQDLRLPDMAGIELTRQLRELPGGDQIPIIALSGFRIAMEEAQSQATRFNDYLFKPILPSVLIDTVRQHLPVLEIRRADSPAMPHKRILIVDDDPLQTKLAILRLKPLGFEVLTASSAAEGLALAQSVTPDLIISDVLMPGTDGFDFCIAIRKDPNLADVPVILVSAHYSQDADMKLASNVGANQLVLRTPDFGLVIGAVQSAFNGMSTSRLNEKVQEQLTEEHLSRVSHLLQEQVKLNAALSEKCALQNAQISILGGVADALVKSIDLSRSLRDVLAACLDAGGISKGAIYRLNDQKLEVFQTVGFSESELFHLTDSFGSPFLLEQVSRGEPVLLSRHMSLTGATNFAETSEVRVAVLFPLFSKDRCSGALLLTSISAEVQEADILAFGRAVAGYLGQAFALELAFESRELAYLELENTARIKDEFLSMVSHELRNPLNAILGWSQMLIRGNLDASTAAQAAEVISRNALLQSRLIADMFDLQLITSGKLRLTVGVVELRPLLDAALETVRTAAAAKQIEVHLKCDPESGTVRGDAERLQQVLWNLLSNAVKFTPKRGHVEVRLERAQSFVHIHVSDDGPGIDSSVLPYIFDRFRQVDPSSTRNHGGLGLGLSIAKSLMELHGGSISASHNANGKGALFTVIIPVPAFLETVPKTAGLFSATKKESLIDDNNRESGEFPELQGVRVLIVEDQADSRDLVVTVLTQCGAQVTVARSAMEGIANVRSGQPHVLLSDIEMPGEDGYTFLRKVRALRENEGGLIPAAALTGYARNEDRARALAAGFQVHISKPVRPRELAMAVARLAGKIV